ncbi:unnamed protein product [Withania somnifera]
MSSSLASFSANHHIMLPSCADAARLSSGGRKVKLRPTVPRAALVEARPQQLPAARDVAGNSNVTGRTLQVGPSSRDRADDMQAEARAMARAADASVYSPDFLATKYGSRPIKVLSRALQIFNGLGSFALKLWLDRLNGQLDRKMRSRAIELRETFTRLGPTFVKIGQGLSTRPDLCPPEYLEELSELQVLSP